MGKWLDDWRKRLNAARYGTPAGVVNLIHRIGEAQMQAHEHSFAGVWTIYRVYLGTPPMTYPAIPVCTTWDQRDAELLYELLKAAEKRKRVERWHFWVEHGEADKTTTPPLHRGQGAYATDDEGE